MSIFDYFRYLNGVIASRHENCKSLTMVKSRNANKCLRVMKWYLSMDETTWSPHQESEFIYFYDRNNWSATLFNHPRETDTSSSVARVSYGCCNIDIRESLQKTKTGPNDIVREPRKLQ